MNARIIYGADAPQTTQETLRRDHAMTFALRAFLIFALVSLSQTARPASIPADVKRVVTFIFAADQTGNILRDARTKAPVPVGTGFLVGVKDAKNPGRHFGYLVTAKHVLLSADGQISSRIFVRLQRRASDLEYVAVDLKSKEGNSAVVVHSDKSVDIAVVPWIQDEGSYDFKMIPEEMLSTKDSLEKASIAEGSDVFFSGLFVSYFGEKQNVPIVRFGKLAMFPDQPILWREREADSGEVAQLYLAEIQTYGGNSGSPMFFFLGSDRIPGSLVLGPPEIRLAGIVRGSFLSKSAVEFMQIPNSIIPAYAQNIGIAAITPSYLLREILFGDKLSKMRGQSD